MAARAALLALCVVSAALLAPAAAHAEASEAAVKAAFLPRFARYVTWPAAAAPHGSDPFVICVIGSDPFGAMLDQAAKTQSIDGRRVTVRRMDSASGADACQIAFIEGSRSQPAGQILAAIGRKPVLTVTDAANGGQRGIVHFTIASGRVRFFIDKAAAAQRGLSVSSRLLALALGVRDQ